jgi:hypothetical protein
VLVEMAEPDRLHQLPEQVSRELVAAVVLVEIHLQTPAELADQAAVVQVENYPVE